MATAVAKLDIQKVREEFPILEQKVFGNPLVYLDNAATSQKPKAVLDAIQEYYTGYNSNVHRGVHHLSQTATDAYENARTAIQEHLNAESPDEINFVRGTTEAINLVAKTWGRKFIGKDNEVIVSTIEHHSNIVPWQMLCEETGAKLRVIPVNDAGELQMDEFYKLLNEKTKLISVNHISNALGTINPVEEIISAAHAQDAVVMIDGAQAVPHMQVDVQALDADFYCFSGHKAYGPTGIGILYGKRHLLESMPPWHGGGEMIKEVSFHGTTYNDLPYKFEAGTPNICGGIALAAALEYIRSIGYEAIQAQEQMLLDYAIERLQEVEGIRFVGTASQRASVVSFVIEGIHPYDIGVLLDRLGIAIRTGHHCAQPLMEHFRLEGTCRASFAFYNTKEEVDALADGVKRAVNMLK